MTVEQILQETRNWPTTRVDELVKALANQSKEADDVPAPKKKEPSPRLREFVKKIDKVWEGSAVNISTKEMLTSLRRSR